MIEHVYFGCWGEKALSIISQEMKVAERINPAEFKSFWGRRVSVELQRCNASVMSRKAYNMLGGQKRGSELDTFQVLFIS